MSKSTRARLQLDCMAPIFEREADERQINFDGLAHGILLGDLEVEPHGDEGVILINGEWWTRLEK